MQSYTCKKCGSSFEWRKTAPSDEGLRLYCSRLCYQADMPRMVHTCLHCGKRWDDPYHNKRRKYCSRGCMHTAKRERLIREAQGRTEKACSRCRLVKPLLDFWLHQKSVDGHGWVCKDCIQGKRRESARLRPVLAPTDLKVCNTCGETKQAQEFWKDVAIVGGYVHRCMDCCKSLTPEQYEQKRQRQRRYAERLAELKLSNPRAWVKRCKATSIRVDYGISVEEYEEIFESQDGCCAICGRELALGEPRKYGLDHDHDTGKVRQFLCNRCNLALGSFDDDAGLLRMAVDYLERHRAS